jgi:hypothetical protein
MLRFAVLFGALVFSGLTPATRAWAQPTAGLLIVADGECHLFFDGEYIGMLEASKAFRMPTTVGEHYLQCFYPRKYMCTSHGGTTTNEYNITVTLQTGNKVVRLPIAQLAAQPYPADQECPESNYPRLPGRTKPSQEPL